MSEVWKTVEMAGGRAEVEGKYEVSNQGRVRNVNTGRVLREGLVCGYPKVTLYSDGRRLQEYVHRLVAQAFVLTPDDASPLECRIRHRDGNRENNTPGNLDWHPLGRVT